LQFNLSFYRFCIFQLLLFRVAVILLTVIVSEQVYWRLITKTKS